eukprot:sb/3477845/
MKDEDVRWCTLQLRALTLQDELSDELSMLLAQMSCREDMQDFMTDLLGDQKSKSSRVQNFLTSCLERFGAHDSETTYRKDKTGGSQQPKGNKKKKKSSSQQVNNQ